MVPVIILASVVAYTVISASTAFGEERRNYPFYPALLFLAFYVRSWPWFALGGRGKTGKVRRPVPDKA
jgi:hypothetical protein